MNVKGCDTEGYNTQQEKLRRSLLAKREIAEGTIKPVQYIRYDEQGNRHPGLCQFIKHNGKLCDRWPKKGNRYCRKHQNRGRGVRDRLGSMTKKLLYGKRIGPKLTSYVQELLDAPEKDQVRINEEVQYLKVIAGDALALYSAAQELPDTIDGKSNEMKGRTLIMAGGIAAQALEQVVKNSKIAAEINEMGKDKFSIHALHDVIQQIKKIIYLCFDPETFVDAEYSLQLFEQMLNEQLQIPQIGVQGTTITPDNTDQEVLAMDATIPLAMEYQQDENAA